MKIFTISCLIFAVWTGIGNPHLNLNYQNASGLANFAGKEAKQKNEHSNVAVLKAQDVGIREDPGALIGVDHLGPLFLASNLNYQESTMQTAFNAASAAATPIRPVPSTKALEHISQVTLELLRSMSSEELEALRCEVRKIDRSHGWWVCYDALPGIDRLITFLQEHRKGRLKNASTFAWKVREARRAVGINITSMSCRDLRGGAA